MDEEGFNGQKQKFGKGLYGAAAVFLAYGGGLHVWRSIDAGSLDSPAEMIIAAFFLAIIAFFVYPHEGWEL